MFHQLKGTDPKVYTNINYSTFLTMKTIPFFVFLDSTRRQIETVCGFKRREKIVFINALTFFFLFTQSKRCYLEMTKIKMMPFNHKKTSLKWLKQGQQWFTRSMPGKEQL